MKAMVLHFMLFPDDPQFFLFCSQIVSKFLLVEKIKMIGMLLNIVYPQVKKADKHLKQRDPAGFITIPL